MIAASLGLGGVFPDLRSGLMIGAPLGLGGVFPDLRSGLMIAAPLGLGGVFPDLRSGLMIAAPLGLGGCFWPVCFTGRSIMRLTKHSLMPTTCKEYNINGLHEHIIEPPVLFLHLIMN